MEWSAKASLFAGMRLGVPDVNARNAISTPYLQCGTRRNAERFQRVTSGLEDYFTGPARFGWDVRRCRPSWATCGCPNFSIES